MIPNYRKKERKKNLATNGVERWWWARGERQEKMGYDEQEMEKKWRQTRKTTKRLKKPYNWHSMLTII